MLLVLGRSRIQFWKVVSGSDQNGPNPIEHCWQALFFCLQVQWHPIDQLLQVTAELIFSKTERCCYSIRPEPDSILRGRIRIRSKWTESYRTLLASSFLLPAGTMISFWSTSASHCRTWARSPPWVCSWVRSSLKGACHKVCNRLQDHLEFGRRVHLGPAHG
jgi:hypothetical protein